MRRRPVLGMTVAIAGLLVAAAAGVVIVTNRVDGHAEKASATVTAFLSAWERGDTAAMEALVDRPPVSFAATYQQMVSDLMVTKATFRPGPIVERKGAATAPFHATLTLTGLGDWEYDGLLHLARSDGRWRLSWTPASVHPQLQAGDHFTRSRTVPARAAILAADGTPLASTQSTVIVGVQPSKVTDRAALLAVLVKQLGVDATTVRASISRAVPTQFVAVAEVPTNRFTAMRPVLEPIPGVLFRSHTGRVTITPDFAPQTLGRAGDITAELLTKLGQPHQTGDQVGLSGLEQALDRQLGGTPSGQVAIVDAGGTQRAVVDTVTGTTPVPVQTTLDPGVQKAAQAALTGVSQPAALVAVDARSGAVRAVVSAPFDNAFNRALVGRYPPGSTFMVVTATALLQRGLTPSSSVECPPDITAGGRHFTNVEGEQTGTLSFAVAFARSCNTAFIGQAKTLPTGDLEQTATSEFGFGVDPALGVPALGARFPTPGDAVELAAAAIGQGRVDATPLAMASVAAAAVTGTWHSPTLVTGDGAPVQPPAGKSIDPAVVSSLQQLMGLVVTQGTAAHAGLPAGTFGKTGSAEFGTAKPLETHAWFIGARNNLAFAVLVEGGGLGGDVAAPLAAKFLRALPAGT
jgi:cell division protein FtsI/penicillin-binding protein 2